jgi:hypothetical protein
VPDVDVFEQQMQLLQSRTAAVRFLDRHIAYEFYIRHNVTRPQRAGFNAASQNSPRHENKKAGSNAGFFITLLTIGAMRLSRCTFCISPASASAA